MSEITDTDEDILTELSTCSDASVARRISWATDYENRRRSLLPTRDLRRQYASLVRRRRQSDYTCLELCLTDRLRQFSMLAKTLSQSRFLHGLLWHPGQLAVLFCALCGFCTSAPLRSKPVSITAQGLSMYSACMPFQLNAHSRFVLDLGCLLRTRPGSLMSVILKRISKHQYARMSYSLCKRKENRFAWRKEVTHSIKTDEEALSKRYDGYTPWNIFGLHDGWKSLALAIKEAPQES